MKISEVFKPKTLFQLWIWGGSMMFFWAFYWSMYPATLRRLMASRDKNSSCIKTVHENLKQSAEALYFGSNMTFQKNNDPKLSVKSVKNGLRNNQIVCIDLVHWSYNNFSNIRKYRKLKMRYFTLISTKFAETLEKLKIHDLKYYSTKFGTFITTCTIIYSVFWP